MRLQLKPNNRPKVQRSGGLAFYSSLVACCLVALLNLTLFTRIWADSSLLNWLYFGAGVLIGAAYAFFFIRGRLHVFIHELKHSIPSNLAGNRFKKLEIDQEEGAFHYAYTKDTAAYNAFIALAPYCLPLFTFCTLLLGYATSSSNPNALLGIVGVGYGIDLVLNTRDISPVQTDLSMINGGYGVAVFYVVIFNICVFSFLAPWVSLGSSGIRLLTQEYWVLIVQLSALVRKN